MIPVKNIRRFLRKAVEQPGYAIKTGYKRLLAYFYHDFKNGEAPSMPESVTLFLTHRCNLRCRMCGQWGDEGVKKDIPKLEREMLMKEMSFDILKKLVDDLSVSKSSITLFGGEPFIHKDIMPLIKHIKSNKLHCLVITNGLLLKNFAKDIVEYGLDELNLSLDGDEQRHDEIRGMKGLFARITEGIAEINKYKELHKTNKPLINLQCTISKFNYDILENMLDIAKNFKANSITFHHLIFLNDKIYEEQDCFVKKVLPSISSADWKGFIFEPGMDIEKLIAKLNYLKSQKTDFFLNVYPNFSDDEIRDYYTNIHYLPKSYKPRCVSPWIVTYVFPDGEVKPCLNINYSFGNLKQASFKNIWNSPQALNYRKVLKESKIFPACIRCTELFRY